MKKKLNELDNRILDFIKAQEGARIPFEVLSAALNMEKASDEKRLKKYIIRLVASRYLKRTQSGLLEIPEDQKDLPTKKPSKPAQSVPNLESGVLQMNRYGIGFVRLPGMLEDVRIPQKYLGTALPGDLVEIQVFSRRGQERIEGKINRIVDRGSRIFVGDLIKQGKNHYYIQPDPQSVPVEFFVKDEHLNGAVHGDKVSFRLRQWEFKGGLPEAEIVESLGKSGTNDAEILAVLAGNQLKNTFPEDVERDASLIPKTISDDVISQRKDIRDWVVFTIDPFDAKDFDDALSIEILENGNWYLGVHIADVTHYMKTDTALDVEALSRATSVYMVDRVIPMLPEVLSNGVCSLVPHEDRLTYSCFMEINAEGVVVNYEIGETVIHSKRRYTYEEAQSIIEGKDDPFSEQIGILSEMTQLLTQNRLDAGAIDFESPEPQFKLDEKGWPLEVYLKERMLSHRLIEECMLLANRTVSEHIDKLRTASNKKSKDSYPFLYRIHDKPNADKLMNVAELVGPLGIRVKFNVNDIRPSHIIDLLTQVKNTTLEKTVNELVLRSMAKAIYSPDNIGHFGLHFDDYSHFTSPIRRYPDVIVHRLLKAYGKNAIAYSYDDLADLGRHCSDQEKSAQNAERDSVKLKQVEYMSKRKGQAFEGVISGVTDFGIFVVLNDNYCEGMVRLSELVDDFYVYEAKRHMLTGRKRGKTIRLGDSIRVIVSDVSIEQKQIFFQPAKK
jgi:ribonuclease R